MSEQECRYPCGCDQFPEEHCSCMDGHRICEMAGCSAAGVGLGDIDGDQFYLCDEHRYPVPRATESTAVGVLVDAVLSEARGYRVDRAVLTVALSKSLPELLEAARREGGAWALREAAGSHKGDTATDELWRMWLRERAIKHEATDAVETHCHADGHGPCLASDCPIAGMGPLRGHLRPCPGAPGPQHASSPSMGAGRKS